MGWLFAAMYDVMTRKAEEAGVREWRAELLAGAAGRVVELGAGTGLNLPLYPESAAESVAATEPDRHMRSRLDRRARSIARPAVEVVDASADSLPFDDGSVDTVVSTLVLCTVPDAEESIREAMRVLRPGGALIFLEHVAHDDPRVYRRQRRWEPFWKWFAQGCHLTRPTGQWIRDAGFEIESETPAPMPKAPEFLPTIRGVARKPR